MIRVAIWLLPLVPILAAFSLASGDDDGPGSSGRKKARLGGEARADLADRFGREIWPMIAEPEDSGKACLACHRDDEANTSLLIFSGDSDRDFERLATEGYFDRGNPASLLARIARKAPEGRMPPEPLPTWSKKEIDRLRSFIEAFGSAGDEPKGLVPPGPRP